MTRFEGSDIEMKLVEHGRALAMVPAIGQQDSANIEKDYVEGEHRRLIKTVISEDQWSVVIEQ